MYSFQEYLKEFFEINKLSYSNAEKLSGINRTVLSRYVKGLRVPKNEEVVYKLISGLHMTEEEGQHICDAYSRVQVCKEFFVNYNTVKKIIDVKVNETAAVSALETDKVVISENVTEVLGGKEDILRIFRYMLKDAAFLKIDVKTEYLELQNIVLEMITYMQEDGVIEQIIELEDLKWQYCERKLERVARLLPVLLQRKNSNIYYYVDKNQCEEGSVGPNCVITDKGILMFTDELAKGIFSNQRNPYNYFNYRYDAMKKQMNIYASGGEQQYKKWSEENINREYRNEKTDMIFACSESTDDIWIVSEKEERAVCINERGIVNFLKIFIWR